MATPNGHHHARKMIVVTIATVVVVLATIGSYTYLEATGDIPPQWALLIPPFATGLLSYLKSIDVEVKTDAQGELVQAVADRVVAQLQLSQTVAHQALAALPPQQAKKILHDAAEEAAIPPDEDLRSPTR